MTKILGFGLVVALATSATACMANGDAYPTPSARGADEDLAAPAAPGTCVAGDAAAAKELSAQVAKTTSVAASTSAVFRAELALALAGTALETIDLGSAGTDLDYTFDDETSEYVIAKAPGELRFRLYWGEGHPREGEPLTADAFATESYLVDPDLHLDLASARLSVSYASAGPLVSLLGWGEQPKNPAVVRLSDADRVQETAKNLLVDARVIVRAGGTSIELATAKKSFVEWASDPDPELRLVAGTTTKGASKLTITAWGEGRVAFASKTGVKGEVALKNDAAAMTFDCQ